MGQIAFLNDKGHTAIKWDEAKPETGEKARQSYEEFLAQGFATFVVSPDPKVKTTQIREFDPTAETIGVVKQYVGG